MKLMLFTDTLGDVNGVCRFILNMGEQAAASGRSLEIVTSTRMQVPPCRRYIRNFEPVFATAMPRYENLEIALPPLIRMLRHAVAEQPDIIHISTPGPVGVCGLIAAKMLRAPVLGVYHTDFPAYIDHLFADEVYTQLTARAMSLFYRNFAAVFSRSEDYVQSLERLGVPRARMLALTPGVALDTFRPDFRRPQIWAELGASPSSVKALYVGRVSVEKNLPLLTKAWPQARRAAQAAGAEAELIIVGDGPYREQMAAALTGEATHFLGFRHSAQLSRIYASSDLFVFPSITDTLGQVVLESQASGLPVLVSDRGGPKEVVDDGITGFILPGGRPAAWAEAITRLLVDRDLRQRMGRSAAAQSTRFSLRACFEQFWQAHEACHRRRGDEAPCHHRRDQLVTSSVRDSAVGASHH